MTKSEKIFNEISEEAKTDSNILAFWLDGSRGKELAKKHSDYDCTMIVKDRAIKKYHKKYDGLEKDDIDLVITTLSEFKKYASWESPDSWDRYNFAHQKVLVDKTKKVQKIINEKSKIPKHKIKGFITQSLDHYINQVFRSFKCYRDKQPLAAHLEGIESVPPLLDAIFALEGKVKPYYKYLRWELKEHSLKKLLWDYKVFLNKVQRITTRGDIKTQKEIFRQMEKIFSRAGYKSVFNGWQDNINWIKNFKKR